MDTPVKTRRAYQSPRRREQAQETRAAILRAARELFGAAGYAGTSMAEIARTAHVAPQTVYAIFGMKRGVMFGLLDVIDTEGQVAENAARVDVAQSGPEAIQAAVQLTRHLNEHAGDLLAMARAAAASEPDVAAVVSEGMRRHRAGADRVARRLHALGVLGARTVSEAEAMIGTLTSPDVYASLTGTYGWSFDAAEAWIAQTLCRELIVPSLAD
jgi:AcrR family transcriptional regulator